MRETALVVLAVAAVYRHALAAGDEADNIVPRHGGAAARELDKAVVNALHENAVDGLALLGGLLLAALRRLGDLVECGFLVGLAAAGKLVAQAVRYARRGHAAVAYRGVEIVDVVERQALHYRGHYLLVQRVVYADAGVLQLVLKRLAAADNVLLAALLLEPLLYLRARGAAFCDVQPVAAGAGRGLRGAYLDDVAVLEHIVVSHDAAVDARADHVIADVGMYAVRKIYRGSAGGEVYNVALRGKDEHLVGEHVYLQIVEKVLRVGLLLALQQPANPRELVLIPGADSRAAVAHLVFPVRRDAVFGGVVHVPSAYLHLERDALGADDRRVYALVHVRLRGGYIVLEAAGHGLEHVVDDAEDVITVGDRVHDDAEGTEVEDAGDVEILRVHLAVDAVYMLDAAEYRGVDALGVEPLLHFFLNAGHERFQLRHTLLKGLGYLVVAGRVEVLEREVFKLPFRALHTETVRDGGVYLHRFKRFYALLFGGLIGHRAHVVQTVGNLDENDADVLGHGHEHLAQVLHLFVLFAGVLHTGQLRDALDDVRNRRAELAGDVGVGEVRVLNHVVQQRRDYRVLVKPHVDGDVRRGDAVRHIRRAVLAQLPGVRDARHLVCRADAAEIHGMAAVLYLLLKLGIHLVRVERGVLLAFYIGSVSVLYGHFSPPCGITRK